LFDVAKTFRKLANHLHRRRENSVRRRENFSRPGEGKGRGSEEHARGRSTPSFGAAASFSRRSFFSSGRFRFAARETFVFLRGLAGSDASRSYPGSAALSRGRADETSAPLFPGLAWPYMRSRITDAWMTDHKT
jgi:hypothetical protein